VKRALLALAAALCGCGSDRTAQGPGSETSGLSARVLHPSGEPAAGVWVRACDVSGWTGRMRTGTSVVLDSQRTDESGRVRFRRFAASRIALEARTPDGVVRAESDQSRTDSVLSLPLAAGGDLHVRVVAAGSDVRWVALVGNEGKGVAAATGGWSFGPLAGGWYSVVAATDSGLLLAGRVRIESGGSLDTTLSIPEGQVLLDDFATPSPRNRWGDLLGQGWWYSTTDAGEGGTAAVSPDGSFAAWTDQGCPAGTPGCLHFGLSMDTSLPVHYALVGQDLDASHAGTDTTHVWLDLRAVDSVVLVARGSGSLSVQFPSIDGKGREFQFDAGLVLPATWTRVSIPVSSFAPDTANGLLWKSAGWRATCILFLAQGTSDFWISSISLIGPSPYDLFPELRPSQGDFP
jgi:hypothetical protein